MFLGTYTPKLDDKGRLTLPAKFRDALAGGLMVTKSQDHSLAVYPRAEFEKLARRASQASRSNPEASAFLRNLAAATDEDSRPRFAHGRWRQQRLFQLVVLAPKRTGVAAPRLVGDLERLFEALEALLERRKFHAESVVLLLEPRGREVEPRHAEGALGDAVEEHQVMLEASPSLKCASTWSA